MNRSTTSHWKDSQASEGGLVLSRTARRWLATLVTLGLIIFLVWYLSPPDQVTTRLVPLIVAEFDEDSLLPPIPYVRQDLAALFELEGSRFAISSDAKKVIGTTASNLLGHVRQQLQDAQWTEDDVLVLYVLTHGLTLPAGDVAAAAGFDGDAPAGTGEDEVKTVLADSGFRFGGGGVEIQAVLAAANECEARTKLVVMDASRIPTLPGKGMFVNELAHVVSEELQRKDGDAPAYGGDLWVLIAGGVFEPGLVDAEAGRSVFGRAFEEAIRCPPDSRFDKNGDYKLSVGELFVAVQARLGERFPRQTALLLRGGTGLVEKDADLASTPIVVSTFRDVPPEDAKENEGPATEVASRDQAKDAQTASQQRPPGPGAGAGDAPGGGPAPTARAREPAPTYGGGPPETDGTQVAAATSPAPAAEPSPAGSPAEGSASTDPAPTTPPADGAVAQASPESPPGKQPRRPIFDRTGDEKKSLAERVREELERAWKLNGYLASRDTRGNWSPVDYAPIAWRRSEARLIGFERDHRLDRGDANQKRILTEITAELNRLEALAEATDPGGPTTATSPASSPGNELLEAWQRFWGSQEQQLWREAESFVAFQPSDPAAASLRAYMAGCRTAADQVYAAGEYAAFLDALLTCGATDTQARNFAATLKEFLTELAAIGRQLRDGSGGSSVTQPIESAERLHDDLQEQVRRSAPLIEPQQTTGAVPPAAMIALRKAKAARDRSQPLPPGREDEDPPPAKDSRSALFGTRSLQERLRDRAEVYGLLVKLAQLPEIDPPQRVDHISVDEGERAFLLSTRRVGRQLATAMATIAERVADSSDGEVLKAQRARLLDPHTIAAWAPRLRQSTFTPPFLAVPDKVFLSAVDEQGGNLTTLRLAADSPRTLPLSIHLYGLAVEDATLTFRFDGDAMTVRHAGHSIASEQPKPLAELLETTVAGGGAENIVKLEIVGKPARSDSEPDSHLTVSVQARGHKDELVVRCIRPLVRPFLLTVDAGDGGPPQTPSGAWSDPLYLRPYANRRSPFAFQLKNLSGAAKTVDVQLYAAQQNIKRFRQYWRERDPEVDVQQHLKDLLGEAPVLVGEMKGLALQGQETKDVVFTKEKPQQPPAADANGAPAEGAAAPAEEGSPPPDVRHGMIAVVQDGDRQTHFFMEIEPKPPGSFLKASGEILDRGGGQILQIRIEPLENVPGLADAPLIVRFSEDNPVLENRRQIQDRSEIASRNSEAHLEFATQRGETDWQVLVDVGSTLGESEVFYNRAFYLQITDERRPDLRVENFRDAQNRVRIEELAAGADEEDRIRFRGAEALQNAQFSVRRQRGMPAPTITIQFHADARSSAFTKYGDRLRLAAQGQLLFESHADRRIAARAVELGPDGLILETRVEDFQYEWTPNQSEAKVPLRLELALEEGGQAADEVNVTLDEQPPVIRDFPDGTLRMTSAGAPQVELRARDGLTGISRVEIARSGNQQAPFGERDQVLETVNSELVYDEIGQVHRWRADLPPDLAKPGETVRLVARVFDGVGHASEPDFAEVTIPRPQAPPPPPKGSIVGTASFNGTPTKAIVVELQGPVTQKRLLDGQRGFRFDNLPAGDYTITAAGEVRLQVAGVKEVSGEVEVNQFDPRRAQTRRVTLKLE